jgi:hypothetical protein
LKSRTARKILRAVFVFSWERRRLAGPLLIRSPAGRQRSQELEPAPRLKFEFGGWTAFVHAAMRGFDMA